MEQTRSSKFAQVVGAIYIAIIIAVIFIYKVVGGDCDISGKTDKCDNSRVIVYMLIFGSAAVIPLCAATYAVLFVMERL